MSNTTNQAIYEMLIENTGTHFLDSGGDDGRHWQHNQKKTLIDFENEEYLTKDDDIITKSLFHHLSESCEYLPDLTKQLNDWINQDKWHGFDNRDGRSNTRHDVEQFMQEYVYIDQDIDCTYTYNFDNCLSQSIQYLTYGDIWENPIIALSIHNGADARGGLTDYRFFKIDLDQFYCMFQDYYEDDFDEALND